MGRKLYAGNLPYSANQRSLEETFGRFGMVDTVKLVTDRFTGESRGFAFVEMSLHSEAQKAIQELNGSHLDRCVIKVNEARARGSGRRREKGLR